MALVRSALEVGPYAIGDDEEGEEHGDIPGTPSLATSDEAIDELQRLDHAHSVEVGCGRWLLVTVDPGAVVCGGITIGVHYIVDTQQTG